MADHRPEHRAHHVFTTHIFIAGSQYRGSPEGKKHDHLHAHGRGAGSDNECRQGLVQVSAEDNHGELVGRSLALHGV